MDSYLKVFYMETKKESQTLTFLSNNLSTINVIRELIISDSKKRGIKISINSRLQ